MYIHTIAKHARHTKHTRVTVQRHTLENVMTHTHTRVHAHGNLYNAYIHTYIHIYLIYRSVTGVSKSAQRLHPNNLYFINN